MPPVTDTHDALMPALVSPVFLNCLGFMYGQGALERNPQQLIEADIKENKTISLIVPARHLIIFEGMGNSNGLPNCETSGW
jgi:hypothetical protein